MLQEVSRSSLDDVCDPGKSHGHSSRQGFRRTDLTGRLKIQRPDQPCVPSAHDDKCICEGDVVSDHPRLQVWTQAVMS